MSYNGRNLIATGVQTRGSAQNPILAAFGPAANEFAAFQPYAALFGRSEYTNPERMRSIKGWVSTASGTGATVTQYLTAPPTCPLLTTGTANGGIAQIQESTDAGTTAWPKYKLSATKDIIAAFRVLPATMADNTNAVWVGLNEVDTSIFASGVYACNSGIGFIKAAGAATFVGQINKTNASTLTATSALGSFVASTAINLGIWIHGVTSVDFFVNGVKTVQTTVTNLPTTAVLAVSAAACNAVDGTTSGLFRVEMATAMQELW